MSAFDTLIGVIAFLRPCNNGSDPVHALLEFSHTSQSSSCPIFKLAEYSLFSL